MKFRRLLPLTFLTASAAAEVESEIPLGIEVVTGWRSEYIQRGFKWANDLLDVQGEAEIALTDNLIANLGGWYATTTGGADFDEAAAFARIGWEKDELTLALETTWKSVSHTDFDDGLDIMPTIGWRWNEDLVFTGGLAWNTGADGLYAFAETRWSHPLGRNAFVSADAGLSWVSDYYDRSGLNDLYARLAYTQVFNRSVSLTPFVGTSLPLQSNEESARLFGGVWFEVNF